MNMAGVAGWGEVGMARSGTLWWASYGMVKRI